MDTPREWTKEEVQEKFLNYCWGLIRYWKGITNHTEEERMAGVVFSILTMLDGESIELPGFIVAPLPSIEDKPYLKEQGENWFPENNSENINCDISGNLHERFYQVKKAQTGG